jgi:hypothetical protein
MLESGEVQAAKKLGERNNPGVPQWRVSLFFFATPRTGAAGVPWLRFDK